MKCEEREMLIDQFYKSLPDIEDVEHEWDNIATSDEGERYICKHCMGIMFSKPTVQSTEEE